MSLLLKFHLTLDFVQPHVGCIQLHVVGCKRYLAYDVIRRFSSVWVLALHSSSYPWPTTHTHTHKSHEDSVHLFIVHWSLKPGAGMLFSKSSAAVALSWPVNSGNGEDTFLYLRLGCSLIIHCDRYNIDLFNGQLQFTFNQPNFQKCEQHSRT